MSNLVQITASDGALGDELGSSVAISGDTAIVGAHGKNSNAGAVYIYVRNGMSWIQQAELTASDGISNDWFGASVAISGDTVIVGANFKDSNTGAAYVYVRNGTSWTQQAKITASDGASGDMFGGSVEISGDRAIVGAEGKNSFTGAAYIYVRDGTSWTQQAKVTASDGASGDMFGVSAAISGDTAIVGADSKNSFTGAAYIYVRDGTSWTQQAKITASDGLAGDIFGVRVAISGDRAIIGALGKNSYTGGAYIFIQIGTNWIQQAVLSASDAALDDWFGVSVAISGNTAIVGAYRKNLYIGEAYIYAWNGADWTEQGTVTANDGVSRDMFGFSVAISGDTALVGAYGKNENTGAAYIYLTSTPPSRGIKFFEGSLDFV